MKLNWILLAIGSAFLVGCSGPAYDENAWSPPPKKSLGDPPVQSAEAGVKVDPKDPGLIAQAQTMSVATRANPFALLGTEVSYDRSQLAASLSDQMGFYSLVGESKTPPPQPSFQYVEEPTRRLAGVMIGETVSALIDMNEGGQMQIIRPGSVVKNAAGQDTWVVESIDEEKAILRRLNREIRPTHIVVRLQTDLGSGGGGGGGARGGGNQGGGNQGGAGQGDPRGGGGNTGGNPRGGGRQGGRRDD